MDDLISVIVPIYNVESYLKQCVDSILAQTYKNLEIILVNDGSTDQSGTICEEYKKKDSRICVVHKENGGLSSARNAGLDIATGEWISFVDGDDFIAKDMLNLLQRGCLENDVLFSMCGMEYFSDGTDEVICVRIPQNAGVVSSIQCLELIIMPDGLEFSACTSLSNIEFWREQRFPEGKYHEDLAVMYKVIDKARKVCMLDKALYFYRKRTGTITDTSSIFRLSNLETHAKGLLDYIVLNYPKLSDIAVAYYIRKVIQAISISAKERNKEYYKKFREKILTFKNHRDFLPYLTRKDKLVLSLIYFNLYYYTYLFYKQLLFKK